MMTLENGVLYKFETPTCTVCKMMEPLLQEFVTSNQDVIVKKVNPYDEMDLCEKYGISSLPIFIFVEDDNVQMLSGLVEKKEFNKFTKQFKKTL